LMAEERGGLRHLFEINDVEWLVPFAPLRGLNEAQAVHSFNAPISPK
jgi:hypothetical protein